MGFQRIYQAAKAGKTLAQIQSLFGEELTQQQRQTAYEQGRAAAAQEKAAAAQNNARLAQAYDFRTLQEAQSGQGGLYFAAVSQKVKSNAALAQLRLIDAFAKEYGLQVRLFDTLEHGAVNGLLEKGTNIINLALDAQDGALTRTVSHEAYHYIAQQSQEQAQRLEAFVRQRLESAEDYDLDARIQEKQEEYRRSGVALTAEEAMEEITADSVLDVIGTEENIQRLVKQDQKLAAKVGQVIKTLAEKLRQLMSRFAKHSPEARALSDDLEYTEKIARMMEEALATARENYRMAQEGQFTAAKQDAAVQAYISDMQTAATAEDAQAAMNGLVSDLFARSQTAYLAARPDLDLNDAVARFGEALKGFGTGESPTVQGALARAGFNSPQDGGSILAPLAYAGKKLAGMEERGMETETKYQMKTNPRVDEKTLEENKKTVSAMNPVKELTGDEFTVGGSDLRNQVAEYFEQIGATAYNDELGDVELTRRGVKDSVSHGIGKEKAAAFAAVKDVLENGRVIDFQKNWKGRDYDTAVVSAPITIGGEDYYMGVVVKRTWNAQSFYLHEVILQKESGTEGRSTRALNNQLTLGGVNPTINSILETVRNYKGETEEKVSTDSDHSYDLKEQSLTAQVSQDAALQSQLESDGSIRAAAELMQKLHRVVRRGDGYLQESESEPALKAGAWDKRRGAIADKLLSETGSAMSRNTLMRRLSTLYRGMDRLDMDTGEMLMYARSVGRQLLESSPGVAQQQDETTQRAVQALKNNAFYLTDDMKSEIRSTYGTLESFTRKNFGKMKIRSQESAKISLAELWTETLNPLSPGTFAADATEADMPIILDAYLETAGKKRFNGTYGANIDQYAADLGLSMMLEYYDVPGGIGNAEGLRQQFIKAREDMRQSYAQHYQERLTSQAQRREEYRQRDALRSQILRDSKCCTSTRRK